MRRKVIQIADSTQLVSLPRKWALQHGIKKGDEVEVKEDGSKIIISTDKGEDLGSVEVDITGLDRDSLMFLVRCLYYKGYDEIKVNFSKPTTMHHKTGKEVTVVSSIHEEVNRLNGIEVIQQKETYCLIKDISEGSIKEFDDVLRRLFLLLEDSGKDLLEGVKSGNFVLLDTINEKHNTITKFAAYNLRLLNKFGHPDSKKTNSYYHIISSIDEIIDTIKYSARYVQSKKINASKDTVSILQSIHSVLSIYVNFFYKFDFKKVDEMSRKRTDILEKISTLTKRTPPNEILILSSMEQILEVVIHMVVTRMALEY
jgi:phosphate uptake regulator